MEKLAARAQTLVEALPYLQKFRGATMVVKYGGKAMAEPGLKAEVLKDVVLLRYVGMNPILAHGGGPELSAMMERLGMTPKFVQGLRVTDQETMEIAEMVLVGKTNRDIVGTINQLGGKAVGLSGKDAGLLMATKLEGTEVDLGFVGVVEEVDPKIIEDLTKAGYIPVVAPIATSRDGTTYNINADHVAGKLASALYATKLIILTDVRGVLEEVSDPESLISVLSASQAQKMIAEGKIESGMVPKVQACLDALAGGVPRTHIIDGTLPHSLLMELFTDVGIGTMVTQE